MSFDYRLALITGVDIPIIELGLVLHQPTIREISMLGEADFFIGLQILTINKALYIEDQSLLDYITNFQVFLQVMNEKQMADKKQTVFQVLSLLFPKEKAMLTPRSLMIGKTLIDDSNFENLQEVLNKVFCLENAGQQAFNPGNEKAKEIAKKLMRARERVAAQTQGGGSMFSQYLSVLAVGVSSMSLKDTIELTLYQMYDMVERYILYINWDLDIKSRLAGGKSEGQIENWMKQIH